MVGLKISAGGVKLYQLLYHLKNTLDFVKLEADDKVLFFLFCFKLSFQTVSKTRLQITVDNSLPEGVPIVWSYGVCRKIQVL